MLYRQKHNHVKLINTQYTPLTLTFLELYHEIHLDHCIKLSSLKIIKRTRPYKQQCSTCVQIRCVANTPTNVLSDKNKNWFRLVFGTTQADHRYRVSRQAPQHPFYIQEPYIFNCLFITHIYGFPQGISFTNS